LTSKIGEKLTERQEQVISAIEASLQEREQAALNFRKQEIVGLF